MSEPAPTHVNQLTAGGRFRNGTSSARYDCTTACIVMEADAATGGRIRLTTTQVRQAQDDQKGGIGLDDGAQALARLAQLHLTYGRKTWGTLTARWRAGDGAIVQGSYAVVPAAYSSQPGFPGGHAIRVRGYGRPGWLIVNDPLATGPREWPESVVQRFWATGLGLSGWIDNAAAGAAVDSSGSRGSVVSVVNATRTAGCTDVRIITPAHGSTDAYPIPRESIGQECVSCAPGYVPAIVATNPLFWIAGWTNPADFPGQANACVREGTKPGDRPFLGSLPGVAGDVAGDWVGGLIAGIGDVGRNLLLLTFALVVLLLGLYVLATADEGGSKP